MASIDSAILTVSAIGLLFTGIGVLYGYGVLKQPSTGDIIDIFH